MQNSHTSHFVAAIVLMLATSAAHAELQTWRLTTTSSGNLVPAYYYEPYSPGYLPPIPSELEQGKTVLIDFTIETLSSFGSVGVFGTEQGYEYFMDSLSINGSSTNMYVSRLSTGASSSMLLYTGMVNALSSSGLTFSGATPSSLPVNIGLTDALQTLLQPGYQLHLDLSWGYNAPSPAYTLTVGSYRSLTSVSGVPEAGGMALALSGLVALGSSLLLARRHRVR